jgi:hypothetical protein
MRISYAKWLEKILLRFFFLTLRGGKHHAHLLCKVAREDTFEIYFFDIEGGETSRASPMQSG